MGNGIQGILGKIFKFNKDRGLLDKGFDYNREAGFLMSESLELIDSKCLAYELIVETGRGKVPKDYNHDVMAKELMIEFSNESDNDLDDAVLFADTGVDQFIFWVGGMLKMGLPMGEIENIIHIVCDANLQKTGGVDENNKQRKGTAFKSPDDKIRERFKLLPQFKDMK